MRHSFNVLLLILLLPLTAYASKTVLINTFLTHFAKQDFAWQCAPAKIENLTKNGDVKWLRLRCHGKFPTDYFRFSGKETGILKINLVTADISSPHIKLVPQLARTSSKKQPFAETLLQMGRDNPKFIAGINGGYFYTNRKGHVDLLCLNKHYPELTPRNISDGLLIIDGNEIAQNCEWNSFVTKGRSSLLLNQARHWYIHEIPYESSLPHILSAIGAGPALIKTVQGKPRIDIRWEGIFSTFEFSANSAVALATDVKGHQHVIFFTVDGVDGKAGMDSPEMANFIYFRLPRLLNLKLQSAMSMDQGHSTTLYIRDANPQIVSQASKRKGVRRIVDGLFIEGNLG